MTARLKHRFAFWTAAAFLTAGIAAALPGRGGADEKPAAVAEADEVVASTFIGELSGAPESARVAVVVHGTTFTAYVCSADQAFNDTFSRWFRGAVKDGKMSATAKCGAEFAATLSGAAVSGSLKKEGKTHEFTAKQIAADANAGLFRAAEAFGEDDYIVGWIVDEKESIVGTGGKAGGKVQTLQPPKGNGNLAAKIGDKKVDPAKVSGGTPVPVPPAKKGDPAAPVRKLDAAARAEILQDLVDRSKAEGGNPVQAILVHQMKRFAAGKKPETKLEERTFAILKTAPGNSIADYVKNWEALPQATRTTILGPAAGQLDPNKGLEAAAARKLAVTSPRLRTLKAAAPAAASGIVKGVTAPTVRCIDETNPEFIGADEVFAIHTVIVGNGQPVVKRTGLLTGMEDGVQKSFSTADAAVFPLEGQSPTAGAEVLVVTTLYEDDGSGVVAVVNFLKPLIQVAVIVAVEELNGDKKELSELDKVLIKIAVDGAISAVSGPLTNLLVQPLGTDSIVVKPDGSVVAENGGAKTAMRFRKVKNGDVRFDYELKGFQVQR